jgi:catechol 2,3-dioxygenase-like lactoylglutathione lyase family enzyme
MLQNHVATATVGVRNLAASKRFYENTLGLEPLGPQMPGVTVYKCGDSKFMVYESRFAGTNQATAVTWSVGADFERVVRDLQANGVQFEHYDLPDMRHEGVAHVIGDMRAAWFKDPDGNIHSLVNK